MKREVLLGPWKMISWEATSPEGEVIHPLGETPSGMLMYDPSGYMSAVIARSDRPKFASGDVNRGMMEEIKVAFEGFEAYCGRYEMNLEEGIITHYVETSRFPEWEGSEWERFVRISGNWLLIKTPPFAAYDTEWVSDVVFERPEGFSSSSPGRTGA